jgi:hypothetical protein
MFRKLTTYIIFLGISLSTLAQEELVHCRETLDCPMYPYDACFAETEGLVCHNVRK